MTRHQTETGRKALIQVVAGVILFSFAMLILLMMVLINAGIGDNFMSTEIDHSVNYKAHEIRVRSTVTNIMYDRLYWVPSIDAGKYGKMRGYRVISRFLTADPSEKVWTRGGGVPYSEAKTDIKNYIERKMGLSYGNTGYRVTLKDDSGTVIDIKENPPQRGYVVEYPISMSKGREGKIKIVAEGGKILHVR